MLWSHVVDILRGSLFVLAHLCGGSLGTAIILASAGLRILLLPLTLPATRRRLVREQRIRELAPTLERIKRKHADRPDLVLAATKQLYEEHGLQFVDRQGMLDSFLQFPPAAALYSAIRGTSTEAGRTGFLWIRDLANPDHVLALGAAFLTGLMARASASSPDQTSAQQMVPALIATVITFVVLSKLSAGVALYSVVNSLVGWAERGIALRSLKHETTA